MTGFRMCGNPWSRGVDVVGAARHSDAPVQAQTLRGRGGRKQLWFKPEAAGAWLELPFKLEQAVSGDFVLALSKAADYGMYRVFLDGQEAGALDLYGAAVVKQEHPLGRRKLDSGEHVLRFECLGKNAFSGGFLMGFEELAVRIPRYLRPEGKSSGN